jgi:hypothetical protein
VGVPWLGDAKGFDSLIWREDSASQQHSSHSPPTLFGVAYRRDYRAVFV